MSDVASLNTALKRAVASQDYTAAAKVLGPLKLALLQNNALIPSSEVSPQVLAAACEILETGAIVSIHLHDYEAFGRYYAQLQPFYADQELSKTPSRNKNKIIGLYLMLLLTRQNISEFHITLELLGEEEKKMDPFLKYPINLEQWLMEGSYDKVWKTMQNTSCPSAEYSLFTDTLTESIRDEIASCSEKAYSSLPVSNAKQLLFLGSEGAVVQFVQSRPGWEIKDSVIHFTEEEADRAPLATPMVIENTIRYAQELETIV